MDEMWNKQKKSFIKTIFLHKDCFFYVVAKNDNTCNHYIMFA